MPIADENCRAKVESTCFNGLLQKTSQYRYGELTRCMVTSPGAPKRPHLVLFHPHVQRYVVRLGPTPQGRQPQHRVLVTLSSMLAGGEQGSRGGVEVLSTCPDQCCAPRCHTMRAKQRCRSPGSAICKSSVSHHMKQSNLMLHAVFCCFMPRRHGGSREKKLKSTPTTIAYDLVCVRGSSIQQSTTRIARTILWTSTRFTPAHMTTVRGSA